MFLTSLGYIKPGWRIGRPAENRHVDFRPQYSAQKSTQRRARPVCHHNQMDGAENTAAAAAAAAATTSGASVVAVE